MSPFEKLHPSLQYHVVNSLGWSTLRPTQLEAIEPIHAGVSCLLLAPTAGGKTEAAIIPVLSRMLTESWPGISVLYVCPIKALLNNLEHRLSHYAGLVGRRVAVWHGDVSQSQKNRALRDAPDILLTTPESLEGMLISTRVDREVWFNRVRVVIVDELHAFAADDRGWHLRSIMHRLQQYVPQQVQRIGLSATVSNPIELLDWFSPQDRRQVVGMAAVTTDADVTIDFVGSLANAATVIERLYRGEKRLVFCDSRSSAEELGSSLRGQGVRTFVSHASLSQSERKLAETAFSEEKNCVIVATSTLELGIDVGDLDRVIQIDAPATVSSFLQRMGRTGRRTGSRRNCLFLTTTDDAFLQALGVTQKWSECWVEAAMPPPEPWHIVAQQMMVSMLERGQRPRHELHALMAGAFPELPVADIGVMVTNLVDTGFLSDAGGLLQIGPEAEREYGRAHYRDLLASFSGAQLLTGRHGSTEVGYIDPTMLVGEKVDRLILLGGRSWRITQVEWSKQTVWLEPAKEGGKSRWMGGARSIGYEVCQAIKEVIQKSPPPEVTLSRRAIAQLEVLTAAMPASASPYAMNRLANGHQRLWTYAGTRRNRTLAKKLGQLVEVRRFDALGIDLVSKGDLPDPASLKSAQLNFSSEEIMLLAEAVKFSACVSADLLRRLVMARNYDLLAG